MAKKNEKLAYIRRKPVQTQVPKLMVDQSMQYAGAEAITGTRRAVTGLTQAEKLAIMPALISRSPESLDFEAEVNEFFHTLRKEVPANIGAKLNIKTDGVIYVKVNKEEVEVPNPVNPLDYILYKRAISPDYKQVASTLEESYANNAPFYLIDEETEIENKISVSNRRDDAYSKYLDLREKESKWPLVLEVLKVNPDVLSKAQQREKLQELATGAKALTDSEKLKAYDEFIAAVNDENLEEKAFIKQLIKSKILISEGTSIIYDNGVNTVTWKTEDEAAVWLKATKNSKDAAIIKAKYSEKTK